MFYLVATVTTSPVHRHVRTMLLFVQIL